MPIHFLGSLAETTSISLPSVAEEVHVGEGLGRKVPDRDSEDIFPLTTSGETVSVYALLDHLVNLPHPPQVLYLPPIPSPLPQELLTILHAIRLSAASKTAGVIPVSPVEPNHDADTVTEGQESSIPSASLHCDPLPRDPAAIKEFMRRWAIKPPGTADDGRRIDGIVWADEWSVESPWKIFRTSRKTQDGLGDTWAGVRSPGSNEPPQSSAQPPKWTAEEAKFYFLNSMLPFLLKAPMERSIRLVNVLGPFYSAAVPLIGSSTEERGKASDQLLSPEQNSPQRQASGPHRVVSPIVQSGKASLRNVLLWKHLQKILDALASASHNEAFKQTAIPVPDEERREESSSAGLRQRKGTEGTASDVKESLPAPPPTRKITVQSNILALPVVIGFNRWGIVRPLMGLVAGSYLGWALYILFSPLIYLLTPSTNSALQSILYALSAPVLYDEDDDSFWDMTKKQEDKDDKTGKSNGKAGKGRRDGVKGGGIVRDASWIPYPFAPTWADPLASKIWDQLQLRVETGLKASESSETGEGTGARGNDKSVS
ncbi:hypothetical protein QFC19_004606 [Naganishia cerealis]|uniref:Uncharacterized protein n=1 Tax=Naganishia cerealis TaxID=610337 RepID=A0ACC2VTZ7_9TREE|nr:hypothetical protein QFC19_004606 [Naganishia cerealis]